ncbi:unnamed protein product [Discosporangium mesarthrocarpum]
MKVLALVSTGPLIHALFSPSHRPRCLATYAHNDEGIFQATAWKSLSLAKDDGAPPLVEPRSTDGEDSLNSPTRIDVKIEKLPTFAFFGEGGRREDIIGGRDMASCKASLEEKLGAFLGGRESVAGKKASNGKGGDVVDIKSEDHLRRVLAPLRDGCGPVVVVVEFSAPWCRKCLYLKPVFNRLAEIKMRSASSGQVLFCRANVATWGLGGERELASRVGELNPTSNSQGIDTSADARLTSKSDLERVHHGTEEVERCPACGGSGFTVCNVCGGKGTLVRSSPDGEHQVSVPCPACVGYRKLRCQTCGGKCFMCDD